MRICAGYDQTCMSVIGPSGLPYITTTDLDPNTGQSATNQCNFVWSVYNLGQYDYVRDNFGNGIAYLWIEYKEVGYLSDTGWSGNYEPYATISPNI